MQEGICQLCLQPCYYAFDDGQGSAGPPLQWPTMLVYIHKHLQRLFGVIQPSLYVGCSSLPLKWCYLHKGLLCPLLPWQQLTGIQINVVNTGFICLTYSRTKRNQNRRRQAPWMTHPWVLPKNKHSLTQKLATCSSSVHSDR